MDFRSIIVERLKHQHLTPYLLTKRLKTHVPASTIYDFLAGRTKAIGSDHLYLILQAIGLHVSPTRTKKPASAPKEIDHDQAELLAVKAMERIACIHATYRKTARADPEIMRILSSIRKLINGIMRPSED